MSKEKNPLELFEELGIKLEYGCGTIFGKNIRYSEVAGTVEIGDDNFDRWSNSINLTFEIWLAKGQREFARWYLTMDAAQQLKTPAIKESLVEAG